MPNSQLAIIGLSVLLAALEIRDGKLCISGLPMVDLANLKDSVIDPGDDDAAGAQGADGRGEKSRAHWRWPTVTLPASGKPKTKIANLLRKAPEEVVLRFRHPKSAPIKSVTVNGPSTSSTDSGQAGSRLRQDASARQAGQGKPWTEFSADKETIILKGLTGTVTVTAQY